MSYLKSLPENAVLLDVFKHFPRLAKPLLTYHEQLLRGPSPLTPGEREIIAAYVSGLNACSYCHGVHSTTAEELGIPKGLLAELLADLATAKIDPKMKPVLNYVRTQGATLLLVTHDTEQLNSFDQIIDFGTSVT